MISYNAAAKKLNERGVESPMGKLWSGHQLKRTARRLRLHHPPGYLKNDVVRAQVQALWEQNPDITINQVISGVDAGHRLGIERASTHLRAVRSAATNKSRTLKRIGWRVDRWTAWRIRIAEILRRQPQLTGKQVMEKLGVAHGVRIQWVWYVMHQFRRGSAQPVRK